MAPSTLSAVTTLAPYHLLSFSTLLGIELYQSFILTKLCFWHLPLPQFSHLQKKVFPVYFRLQALLSLITFLTYPTCGGGTVGCLVRGGGAAAAAAGRPRLGLWAGMGMNVLCAGLNWWVWGPRTIETMVKRSHQETKDSRRAPPSVSDTSSVEALSSSSSPLLPAKPMTTTAEPSAEMKAARKGFSRAHAMAIHLNALAMIGTVWYGVELASRIRID